MNQNYKFTLFLYCILLVLSSCQSEQKTATIEKNAIAPLQKAEIRSESSTQEGCAGTFMAYANTSKKSNIKILAAPEGQSLLKLDQTEQQEEAYIFSIVDVQDEWLKIQSPIEGIEQNIEIPGGFGWIHSSVVSADTRNYGGDTLNLLSNPGDGKVVKIITQETSLHIITYCGNWVKVTHQGTEGWIAAKWLCGNPLTTCS